MSITNKIEAFGFNVVLLEYFFLCSYCVLFAVTTVELQLQYICFCAEFCELRQLFLLGSGARLVAI